MNIKSFILLLLCYGLATVSIAQCPTADITLYSQADVDNFASNYPGCTTIPADVNLSIRDGAVNDITNLNGLNQLISVLGTLTISGNSILTNVDGISQITSIEGYLWIGYNDALTNVDGLSQLTSVGEISILGNDALTNVDGLSQLTSVGGELEIGFNDALTNVDGLNQLTSIEGELNIYHNSTLTNIDGLNQLTSVGGKLIIRENSALMNLNGLGQLTYIGERLWITYNNALTNLDGLNQLTYIGGFLGITYNNALTNLDGLNQLTYIGEYLDIYNNSQLNQCCALCPLLTADEADPTVIGEDITIKNNLIGCNSEAEINGCTPCGLVSTSTPESDPIQLTIYPNPAQNIIHFQYGSSASELVNFTIENHLGQQVIQSQAYTNQPVSIDISGYPAGLYSLTVLREGESMSQLFSVNR